MKQSIRLALISALTLVLCFVPGKYTFADSVSVKPFLAFGADLSTKEKAQVMKQFGITNEELADYQTITVTNKEEHQYLDEYLASKVIGTRALSSVMIEEADAGSGIEVETHNISFCSKEMYTNALVTAGISDAKVTVAGPFPISGTAALVGAMKAYGEMTGEGVDEASSDAATNELVATSELANDIGKEKAAQFVALLKDKVVSGDLTSEDEIKNAIDDAEKELGVTIDDENNTITGIAKFGTNIKKLKPECGTAKDCIVTPTMGVWTDFSQPRQYTVISGNRQVKKTYTVTITLQGE